MGEPYSPTVSLPPDFHDEIQRLEDEDQNERTPLLMTGGSLISIVTDPGRIIEDEYPSTSRSIDGRRHIPNGSTVVRRRRLRRSRRVHSESDLRNPRRLRREN